MTRANLAQLTVAQIKAQFPEGKYKSGMKKTAVIDAAMEVAPAPKRATSTSPNREPKYGEKR